MFSGSFFCFKLLVCDCFAIRYSNIYITAPSPDNLKTFFEFVCKGFDALEYKVKQSSFPVDYFKEALAPFHWVETARWETFIFIVIIEIELCWLKQITEIVPLCNVLIYLFNYLSLSLLKEHLDYDVVKSTNPDFRKAIVRINIFKQHRQTIQVCSFLI